MKAHLLVAAPIFPWPTDTGARMRVAHLVRGLSEVGTIDLLVMAGANQTTPCDVPPDAPVERVLVVPRPEGRSVGLRRLDWMVRGSLPVEMSAKNFDPLRAEVGNWLTDAYDLAWIFMPELFVAVGSLLQCPIVVDLFDLEDRKGLRRLSLGSASRSWSIQMRQAAARWQGRRNARLWRDLHDRIGRAATVVTVCSDTDRQMLGLDATVLPNGYELDGEPRGGVAVKRPPTILFQGSMVYAPNADAARLLVEEIAPTVRQHLPDVVVRIVGRHHDSVRRLHHPPAVVVTGHVPDLSAELGRADLVAAPIRYGSGTRIKILEAFAHRIPVVSTPAGAEGLDVADGRHLLIRSSAGEFASACIDALTDLDLRARLVDRGHALFLEQYQWTHVRAGVRQLAAQLTAPTAQGGPRASY